MPATRLYQIAWLVVLEALIYCPSFVESSPSSRDLSLVAPQNDHQHQERRLSPLDDGFEPLSCNENTPPCGSTQCQPWSTVFGTGDTFSSRVTIACGTCVVMDFTTSATLMLEDGMDIQGRLCFPDNNPNSRLQVFTTMIAVQGMLEMQATQPVNGNPSIEFILMGTDQDEDGEDDIQFFTVHAENSDMCDTYCEAGIKPLVVAGGQLNITGMPDNTPTWVNLHDMVNAVGIPNEDGNTFTTVLYVANTQIADTWAAGAEIVITPYTSDWSSSQVRKIMSITVPNAADGLVAIAVNETITAKPTTALESAEFAVEIALLSRNIVFRSATHYNQPDIGGHFWIMHTPRVHQRIDGVEIIQFGQQGNLGRYPIHFHFCGNVSGAVVSRNTIRHSHQRCVVVHGTDSLWIEENVAYDTKGHCFLLEEGIETGNMFVRNLATAVDRAEVLISDVESDGFPSIFWITNPSNSFVGNVAAGCIEAGFWFETGKRGPYQDLVGDPEHMPLTLFRDNVVHSNKFGIRTYPRKGLRPYDSVARFQNLRVYRNLEEGMFLKGSHSLSVEDSIIADGASGIHIHQSNDMYIRNVTIVGMTEVYRQQRLAQPDLPEVCYSNGIQGLELHLQGRNEEMWGITVEDLRFENFNVGCKKTAIISLDYIHYGAFRNYVSFRNVVGMDWDLEQPISLCVEGSYGQDMLLHYADLDGSLSPPSTPATTAPGVLVTTNDTMLHFVDESKCTPQDFGCYTYCTDTCFRSVNYFVPAPGSENLRVAACRRDAPDDCVVFTWDDEGWEHVNEKRRFSVHLPTGDFVTHFVDQQGNKAWPRAVETKFQEVNICPNTFEESNVQLEIPPTLPGQCNELIQNGDMEMATSEAAYWQFERGGPVVLSSSDGVGGSQAATFEDIKRYGNMVQHVDIRCLFVGATYELSAHIKLLDEDGNHYICDPSSEECPVIQLFIPDQSQTTIAEVTGTSTGPDGYQEVKGTLTVDSILADASEVQLAIVWTQKFLLYVDNVKMTNTSPEEVSTTHRPTTLPTRPPTAYQTNYPTAYPTSYPIQSPTHLPTIHSTHQPTRQPTMDPTDHPTLGVIFHHVTSSPNMHTTNDPSRELPVQHSTSYPTFYPTNAPSHLLPVHHPASYPTNVPSQLLPAHHVTSKPTTYQTDQPSHQVSSQHPTHPTIHLDPSHEPVFIPDIFSSPQSTPSIEPTEAPRVGGEELNDGLKKSSSDNMVNLVVPIAVAAVFILIGIMVVGNFVRRNQSTTSMLAVKGMGDSV